jgi:hypothetical protein
MHPPVMDGCAVLVYVRPALLTLYILHYTQPTEWLPSSWSVVSLIHATNNRGATNGCILLVVCTSALHIRTNREVRVQHG